MNTHSFKEDHISQTPALQLLLNLGYRYLSPVEALIVYENIKGINTFLKDIKKPHFVSEEHNFRHCDWVNNVTRQVLYNFCTDKTKLNKLLTLLNILLLKIKNEVLITHN